MQLVERRYEPARPVGARCGFARIYDDGRPRNEWNWVSEARSEMDSLWDNTLDPLMSETEHADAREKLTQLLQKAKNGTLIVEVGGKEAVPIQWIIAELKPFIEGRRGLFGRAPRLMRLYFGEPAAREQMLLALHLANKTNGDEGSEEQDQAIAESIARAHRWAAA
ncbi:hypothetical protein J2X55_002414 [Microbacterium sp. 1154]|uniref:hypothetical protein n=1 Tax=Microbacterium sp. 1154 TaxID=2817733 RepID=UPI002857F1CB|nr:hypothetical protein [Microbacterium sp. 1154]MDR6691491.1 hypothetical protein [Microbacterium sp. 1154]